MSEPEQAVTTTLDQISHESRSSLAVHRDAKNGRFMAVDKTTRFESKFDKGEGCWEWSAGRFNTGYGAFGIKGRNHHAHRVAYELYVGPIPEGLQLDHLCRNRACVNPAHLEPVTCRENLLRGETIAAQMAAVTHCPKGHPYDETNTRIRNGSRSCAECHRENNRRVAARWRAEHPEEARARSLAYSRAHAEQNRARVRRWLAAKKEAARVS